MPKLESQKYFNLPEQAAFLDAIQDGKTEKVLEALKKGMSPNVRGIHGYRPIYFALFAPNADVLKILLKAGADPRVHLDAGNTPLHFAVQQKDTAFAEALLAAGANPNEPGENKMPVLHNALSSRTPAQLRLLAKHKADLDAVWGGNTALQAAILVYAWEMAATLLDLGARTDFKDHFGETSMDMFCERLKKAARSPENKAGVEKLVISFKRSGEVLSCLRAITEFLNHQ